MARNPIRTATLGVLAGAAGILAMEDFSAHLVFGVATADVFRAVAIATRSQ
ncbi:MAG: hypothetical protein H0U92_15305 [Actinobacteria bacterium]|nr:hypothetical protein [Actinomycetota bacterium]